MRVGDSDSVSQWFRSRRYTDRYRFYRGRSMVVQFG